MANHRISAILIYAFLIANGPLAANWPQWRGPNSNGSTRTARALAVNWSQTENVVWRASLPSWSAATPIVWADQIFITSAEEGFTPLDRSKRNSSGQPVPDKIFLFAIDRKDGSITWRKQIDSGNQLFRKQNSASPSPITDGEHVWIVTGNGKFACFTIDGKEVGNEISKPTTDGSD